MLQFDDTRYPEQNVDGFHFQCPYSTPFVDLLSPGMRLMPRCTLMTQYELEDDRCKGCLIRPVRWIENKKIAGFKLSKNLDGKIVKYARQQND